MENPIGLKKRLFPVSKIAKKLSVGVRFLLIWHSNAVPYCQRYTPTDCIFGDFAGLKRRGKA